MLHQIIELGLERRIGLCRAIFAFQIEDQRHQRFGDIASPKLAKMAAFVGHRPDTVRLGIPVFVTAFKNAPILAFALTTGDDSPPDETSDIRVPTPLPPPPTLQGA